MTYSSPLSQRYASPAMQALWGERRRIGLWRRLWLALMEVERELGLDIPERALVELRAHLDDADLERAAEYEKRLRHDVMAHIHHLGEQAPAARAFLHLGATSAYVTDNTDLILMREGLQLLLGRIAAVLVALAKQAGDLDPRDVLKEICSLVDGPVSAEVVAVDSDGMVREGKQLAKIADNIVVKIPMLEAGMVAVRRLAGEGIKTNVTLCFSSVQCLVAAKAGAS